MSTTVIAARPSAVTQAEQDELRARVNALLQEEKISQKQAASEAGIGYSTFAAWLQDTYTGDRAAQAILVRKWLAHREQRREVREALPGDPGFQETPTARRILTMLRYCQSAPDVGVIAGGAGIGKTVTSEEYRRRSPNVFIVTAEPVMKSAHRFVAEVGATLNVSGARTSTRLSAAISDRLSGAGALLIVDEAQHLGAEALDQARSFHDRAKCGLVFLGNQSVYSRMGDGRAEFAQIFSRIGMKITQAKPKAEDVDLMLDAWAMKIDRKLPKQIAQKPGALRGLSKALRIAHMLAAGDGVEVSDDHVRKAWEQIGFDTRLDG
jgi:DNA transposition AAA+ family ATPase